MSRVLMIVIDQLPGHWVKVLDNMPPVNVWDYARLGFAKNFRFLIKMASSVLHGIRASVIRHMA